MTMFEYGSSAGIQSMDFWSEIDPIVTVTSSASTQSLPAIVVADIPTGSSIKRTIMMMKFRTVENTDTVQAANALVLAGTEHIQIDVASAGSFIDAIKLVAAMVSLAPGTRDPGDVWIGDIDISSEVAGNGTYDTQWEGSDCTANSLLFLDVQVGVRVWFT